MINRLNIKEFIDLYNKAIFCGSERFIFEGREILTDYAYYLLLYTKIGKFDDKKIFTYYD